MISCCQHMKSRDPVSSTVVKTQKTWLSGAGAAAPRADRTPAGPELACARMFFLAKQQQGNSPTSLQLGEQGDRRLVQAAQKHHRSGQGSSGRGSRQSPGALALVMPDVPRPPRPLLRAQTRCLGSDQAAPQQTLLEDARSTQGHAILAAGSRVPANAAPTELHRQGCPHAGTVLTHPGHFQLSGEESSSALFSYQPPRN